MASTLVDLLNLAASADPSMVVIAGEQLVSLTSASNSVAHACIDLAHVVFDHKSERLTLDGRFIGLIHLKNILADSSMWQCLTQNERDLFRSLMLSYLSSGCTPDANLNELELVPRIGPTVSELVARFVRNEWLKSNWSDDFWEHLSNCCAWNSFRMAIRAAASFRLPARRRAFTHLVHILIPNLVQSWRVAVHSLTKIKYCVHLTRLLSALLSAIGGNPTNGPFLFREDNSTYAGDILASSFTALVRLSADDLNSAQAFTPAHLSRRLSKLILVTFMVCTSEVRNQHVLTSLEQVTSLLSTRLTFSGHMNNKSVSWLLALLYGILSSDAVGCGAQLPIPANGTVEVRRWLSNAVGTHSTALSELLFVLLRIWFPLSQQEVYSLATDPEGCLSAGGASGSTQAGTLDTCVTYAVSIWDVDSHTATLYKLDLRSLLGLHGAEQQTCAFEPARQLTELLVTLLVKHYGDFSKMLLLQLLSAMKQNSVTALDYELMMRLVQICLPYVEADERWIAFTEYLLTDSLRFVESRFPLNPQDEHEFGAISIAVMATRMLCLLSRCAIYCSPAGNKSELDLRCAATLGQLLRYLNPRLPTSVQVGIRSASLCVRLSAAQSLDWLVDQPAFPNLILSEHSQSLFIGLVELLQEVSECETRVHLLRILCGLVEPADVISSVQLTSQMLSLLDHLWSLDTRTTALRTSVLDAVCLLSTLIHSHAETDETIITFRSTIQPSIATLVKSALGEHTVSGAEALLEPSLRLWSSMVTGDGACWSDSIDVLFPLLINPKTLSNSLQDGFSTHTTSDVLFERLETSEDAELFFTIAEGSLLLACKHSRDQAVKFLQRWTEPFWSTILFANWNQCDGVDKTQSTLDFLCSSAASATSDREGDYESPCRVRQLYLLKRWLSVFMDLAPAADFTGTKVPRVRLTPSLIGFLVSAAWMSLKRAPASAHEDMCPLATQARLSLLACVAIVQGHWFPFLHIVQFAFENAGVPTSRFNHSLSEVDLDSLGPPNLESRELACHLIETCLDRWLARADSLVSIVDRRCFAVACLLALRYCAASFVQQNAQLAVTQPENLDDWASNDPVHSKWLEPVVNLCIQVLFGEDPGPPNYSSDSCFPHPEELSTITDCVKRFRMELSLWESCVGGPAFSDALLRVHVDPALRSQLQTKLFG